MIDITELETRYDLQGSGDYRSPRGNRRHKGRDYRAVPGQPFPSLISGTIERVAYPYSDTKSYCGCVVQGKSIAVKMLYLQPIKKIGEYVRQGEAIGIVQDIPKRYPSDDPLKKMYPHIHVEIESMDPDLIIKMLKLLKG